MKEFNLENKIINFGLKKIPINLQNQDLASTYTFSALFPL